MALGLEAVLDRVRAAVQGLDTAQALELGAVVAWGAACLR
jgi:hypothetical protein